MSAPFEHHRDGVVIRVKARPGARRNALAGLHDGALRIDVTAAPEKGKANDAIVTLLAATFAVAKSSIELISTPANPQKRFLIAGIDASAAQSKLNLGG